MAFKSPITIIGLGQMGIKLASLLANVGHPVTVWNRTIHKANGLTGVTVEENIDKAISKAETIVICVYDYTAVNDILGNIQHPDLLSGKTIINFTTGSPQEAAALETWLNNLGAGYLNGALQVAPDQMGLPGTTILLSGDSRLYAQNEQLLKVFGGNLKYLGSKAHLASAMDLATLAWLYGSYLGLLHGVALTQRSGLNLSDFSAILGEITPGFTGFFQHQINVIDNKQFDVSQSPLSISVTATRRIKEAAAFYELETEFLSVISSWLKTAEEKGWGNKELASLIGLILDSHPGTRHPGHTKNELVSPH